MENLASIDQPVRIPIPLPLSAKPQEDTTLSPAKLFALTSCFIGLNLAWNFQIILCVLLPISLIKLHLTSALALNLQLRPLRPIPRPSSLLPTSLLARRPDSGNNRTTMDRSFVRRVFFCFRSPKTHPFPFFLDLRRSYARHGFYPNRCSRHRHVPATKHRRKRSRGFLQRTCDGCYSSASATLYLGLGRDDVKFWIAVDWSCWCNGLCWLVSLERIGTISNGHRFLRSVAVKHSVVDLHRYQGGTLRTESRELASSATNN